MLNMEYLIFLKNMNKRMSIIGTLLCIFFLEGYAGGRADSTRALPDTINFNPQGIVNNAFGLGERLTFDISYGFITAGEAFMSVPDTVTMQGRSTYKILFEVNSLPAFSWIYRVRDRYETYIDAEGIFPWRFEQHIREGGYTRDFTADFDQRNHVARTTGGTYKIPPFVHDIMSAFYFMRTQGYDDRRPGERIHLKNFYKDSSYALDVKYLGRQQIEVDAGTFNTIVLEPLVKEGGLFKSEGRIIVWLTDDDRKIPVKVSTQVVIGSIDVELREYSGLRGPIPSKIE
jgi:hypothetical protein